MGNTVPKGFLEKVNANPIIKFGGGGLSVFFLIIAFVAWLTTNIDPNILIGVGITAFGFFLLLFVNHILKKQSNVEASDYLGSLSNDIVADHTKALPDINQYKPHIVVTSDKFMDMANYDQKCFRSSFGTRLEHTHNIFYIQLENTPNPPKPVGSAAKVYARLTYTSLSHGDTLSNTPINYASWIGHESPFIDFPINTPRYLVIGAMVHDPNNDKKHGISMWGYDPDNLDRLKSFVQVGGPTWAFKLGVELVIGQHAEWTHRFQFEFAKSERGWSLNQIKRQPWQWRSLTKNNPFEDYKP